MSDRTHEMARRPGWSVEDRGHDTPCWIWAGKLTDTGYGTSSRHGRAHLMVYRRLVGPVPAGLELDHLCRVRCCVNPDHLEPVTHQENMRRAYAHRWTVIEGLPSAVREIRAALLLSQSQLAGRLGVHPTLVGLWERGKHAPSPEHLAALIRMLLRELAEGYGHAPEPDEPVSVIGGRRTAA